AAALQSDQIATEVTLWRSIFGDHKTREPRTENPEPRTLNPEPRTPNPIALLRRALPFAAAGLVANLQQRVAPLLLGAMASPVELGWFGAASRIGRAARLAPQAILGGALPVLSREYGTDRAGAHAISQTLDRALTALSLC